MDASKTKDLEADEGMPTAYSATFVSMEKLPDRLAKPQLHLRRQPQTITDCCGGLKRWTTSCTGFSLQSPFLW